MYVRCLYKLLKELRKIYSINGDFKYKEINEIVVYCRFRGFFVIRLFYFL